MARRNNFESGIFHGSTSSPKRFLKAPLIHVGSWTSARLAVDPDLAGEHDEQGFDHSIGRQRIYKFGLSPTAQIHRLTVPDTVANEAHAQYLQQMGLKVPNSVTITQSEHGKNHPLVKSALRALNAGKIVPYVNDYEKDTDSDEPEISYMVPLPKLNLTQFK